MVEIALCPIRETLTLCGVCGQIFDADHRSEAIHHHHYDGGELPLSPDIRPGIKARPNANVRRSACARWRRRYGALPKSCEACAALSGIVADLGTVHHGNVAS